MLSAEDVLNGLHLRVAVTAEFSSRSPETVALAMNVLEQEHAQDAIDRLIKKQKPDMLTWHKANNGGTNFTGGRKFQLRCSSTRAKSA